MFMVFADQQPSANVFVKGNFDTQCICVQYSGHSRELGYRIHENGKSTKDKPSIMKAPAVYHI